MNVTLRTRLLIGAAVLIGMYVVVTPTDPATVESAAKSADRASLARAPARPEKSGAQGAAEALVRFAHRVTDAGDAGALFAVHSWYVPPPPPPPAPVVISAPPKPTAPPLPYQFMGSYAPSDGPMVIFLTRGDVVLDAHVGDTLENLYSVDKFEGGQLYLTYKPLNIQQQLSAGGLP
ncbi:MAG: hypothetical protein JSR36_09595 [Proteobacteria bacterium]|nr:hypothetical protein [Pseudomonadota bacterium]